jgi:hypothetical protein
VGGFFSSVIALVLLSCLSRPRVAGKPSGCPDLPPATTQ